MSVYTHPLMQCMPNAQWRWRHSAHLVADSLDELHEFARIIGLKRAWFQGDGRLPHYDLTPRRFRSAIAAGVIVLPRDEWVRKFLRQYHGEKASGDE